MWFVIINPFSALAMLSHQEITVERLIEAFPDDLKELSEDRVVCQRLNIEGRLTRPASDMYMYTITVAITVTITITITIMSASLSPSPSPSLLPLLRSLCCSVVQAVCRD